MDVQEILRHLRLEGFCILENVIPEDKVEEVRDSVVEVIDKEKDRAAAAVAKVRAKGHRIGASGVNNVSQLIAHTQSFVPYLADERVLGTTEAMFGPYVKTSATIGLINNPGNSRGYWHSDWPFNQTVANHVPAPYPAAALHLSSIWMLTPFNEVTGGTLVVPGSHRMPDNPSGDNGVDQDAPYPTEVNATGEPGSVLLFDSRLWHCVPPNKSDSPRVAIVIRFAPWWLNLEVSKAGSPEHQSIVVETNGKGVATPPVPRSVYDSLPDKVKPLYRYWVEG